MLGSCIDRSPFLAAARDADSIPEAGAKEAGGCVYTQVCMRGCTRALRAVCSRASPPWWAEGWQCSGAAPRKDSTEDAAPHAPSGPSASVSEWDFPRSALMPHCYLSVSLRKAGAPKGQAEEMLVHRVWGCLPLLKTHRGMASPEPGSLRFLGAE